MGSVERITLLSVFLIISFASVGCNAFPSCASTQTFYSGTRGIIQCSFQGYYALYWYNTTDSRDATPFASYDVESGTSIDEDVSGEFDLLRNGSLVINNVSLSHEHTFRVLMLADKEGGSPHIEDVNVKVRVQPVQKRPLIPVCGKSYVCYKQVEPTSNVTCVVSNSRPAINLTWEIRTINGSIEVPSQTNITLKSKLYTTQATASLEDLFQSVSLGLLVCVVRNSLITLATNNAMILLGNARKSIFETTIITNEFVELHKEVILQCPRGNFTSISWTRKLPDGSEEPLSSILFQRNVHEALVSTYYKSYPNGSLVIPEVNIQHEGSYGCLISDGFTENTKIYDLSVYVKPKPEYPVVEGCSNNQDCALSIDKEGYLTCSLYGIRPSVHLEWRASADSRLYISFSDKQMTIENNGETFDVTTTIFYVLDAEAQTSVNVECKAVQTGIGLSGFSGLATNVKLHPRFDIDVTLFSTTSTTAVVAADVGSTLTVVLVVACSFSVVVIVIIVFTVITRKLKDTTKERKNSREGTNEEEEEVPLNKKKRTSGIKKLQSSKGSKTETWTNSEKTSEDKSDIPPETKKKQKPDKFKVLLEELKDKYEDIYRSVQPIPYLRDKLCVNDVFVEFGIEYNLDKDSKGEWKGLDSYSRILELPGTTSKKIIIEADPGFGKSTLTTQMLYDWCSSNETYLSQNIDLLIFLRLRQLRGFSSIYLAVKSLLLAKDSSLSDSDIKHVFQSDSVSVCFILDGYDEYSHHNTKSDSDIVSIIEGKLFRPSLVILTTRTAILPKRYLQKTAFVRLTGFNDKSRNDYIKKAIVGKDKDAGERISQRLKETPILGDLCEVPLFFAIFAQMAHTGEDTKTLNTVTKFFRFMISCFNRHMQNKMEDENTELLTDSNDEHSELDRLAFEGLLGKEQNIMWDKKVLCQKLSGTVYEKYKKIGILMEEEILEIADDNATSDMDIIGNKTMVRFYHKLFCEWYAAKHLAKFAATEDRMTVWDTLNQLDFIDLQYVYRFACGINVKAAERIVKFLNESEARKEFVILCIMEQKTFSENTLQLARSLCSQHITFKENDDLFLQRCLSQFLQVSSNENIIISNVWLRNVFNSVDMERNCILLKKNIILPSLDTLIALHLLEEHKNLSLEDMAHVLKYVLLCAGIKEIWFRLCFLPSSFTEKNILVDLKKRDIAVYWCPTSRGTFILDSQNGWWQQEDGRVLNDIEYMKVEVKWN